MNEDQQQQQPTSQKRWKATNEGQQQQPTSQKPPGVSSKQVPSLGVLLSLQKSLKNIKKKLHKGKSSSVVKRGYQDDLKPVYFFYEKILRVQKAPKRKTSDFHSFRSFCTRKIVAFVV